jgi:hypothetical protein
VISGKEKKGETVAFGKAFPEIPPVLPWYKGLRGLD